MHTNVPSSSIHSTFKLYPTQTSLNRGWTKCYSVITRNDLWYVQQKGCVSKTLCLMEEAYCMVIFTWNSRKGKSKLYDLVERTQGTFVGDKNVLYVDCRYVSMGVKNADDSAKYTWSPCLTTRPSYPYPMTITTLIQMDYILVTSISVSSYFKILTNHFNMTYLIIFLSLPI